MADIITSSGNPELSIIEMAYGLISLRVILTASSMNVEKGLPPDK